jgi:hypothetical protein
VAADAHVQVAVGVGLRLSSSSSVMLMPPVKAAIDDHQLAVRAQVQPRALERLQQLPRMEPDRLATGVQQRLQEAAGQGGRTHRIQQQAHLHAGRARSTRASRRAVPAWSD